MTCAKEGNQWLVVREFGWNISQPTGRTSPSCLASNIRLWSRQALKFVSVLPQTAPKKLQLVCVPGICTATISPRRSPTSRRSLPLVSWVKEILEMCGRWVVTIWETGENASLAQVVCDTDYWQRDQAVQFKHVDTGVYLGSSGQTFGRPISGQMEIIGTTRPDGTTKWRTQEVWWFEDFPWWPSFFRESTSTHQTSIPNDNRWDMTSCNCDFFPMVMSTQK